MEQGVEELILRDSEQDSNDQGDEAIAFNLNVVLKCTSTNSTEEHPLTFRSTPESVQEIKKAIEASFNVPACTQHLMHESVVLKDADSIRLLHIRSGDTLHLTYKAKAECGDILDAVSWMRSVHTLLVVESPSENGSLSGDAHDFIIMGYQNGIMEDLAYKRFSPWVSPVVQINKLYFLQLGGLDILLRLYTLVLSMPWSGIPVEVKYLECVCMNVLSNLASSLDLRKLIIRRGIIPMCLKSLLRVRLTKGMPIVDESGSQGDKELIDALLQDNISSVIAILANVCELPEVQQQIASCPDALDQMICTSHSPSTQILWSMLVATVFICLANSADVHKYLTLPGILEGLIDVPQLQKAKTAEHMDFVLVSYFTQMFLAQLVLQSPHLIQPDLLEKMAKHAETFLQMATPTELMEYEEKRRFSWSVFFPYVNLIYLPSTPLHQAGAATEENSTLLQKLQLMAIETILFWLHNTLGQESHREILIKENILDYVICVPWYVPEVLQVKAKALVSMLASHTPVEPPRLSILAKAKLSKMHFGLRKMMDVQSVHEVFAMIPH